MATPLEVPLPHLPLERLGAALPAALLRRLRERVASTRERMGRRTFWHVNSTATGGGVAEMLRFLCGYSLDAGIRTRWAVVQGDPPFFDFTKRLHNAIHGVRVRLGPSDREHYEEVLETNARELVRWMRPGDVVFCHDPQTAGLVPILRRAGLEVVWRSHIGHHEVRGSVRRAWSLLAPWLREARLLVFTRAAYVPPFLREVEHAVVHPSIDPCSPKNVPLSRAEGRALLVEAGILAGHPGRAPAVFPRGDGTTGRVEHPALALREDGPLGIRVPTVLQVSRWDHLKDPVGVLEGFVRHVPAGRARLVLAGPDVSGVADDPEGAAVLDEVRAAWHALPPRRRRLVHVVCLSMDDLEENAALVNALQRHAAVVVQKSLYEGFGLTVTEAMWKARPVVAGAVGGIPDQIVHGTHGLLVEDPRDLRAFGRACARLLEDRALADRLRRNARRRALSRFLVTRHLEDWMAVLDRLVPVRAR